MKWAIFHSYVKSSEGICEIMGMGQTLSSMEPDILVYE